VASGIAALGGLFRLVIGLREEFKTGAAIRCEGAQWFPPLFTDGLANGIGYDRPEGLLEEMSCAFAVGFKSRLGIGFHRSPTSLIL
jgi:hypothetical protein